MDAHGIVHGLIEPRGGQVFTRGPVAFLAYRNSVSGIDMYGGSFTRITPSCCFLAFNTLGAPTTIANPSCGLLNKVHLKG